MNRGLGSGRILTLVSAPAGFGKTTLVGEWVAGCGRPVAWLSLDEGDSAPARFLTYLIAALQTIAPGLGQKLLGPLQTPQPPPPESVLTALLNDLAALSEKQVLVLDDYHVIDSQVIDNALAFLLENLPPQLHLVIATREDPALPLGRLRAHAQLAELRAADLRFTQAEAAGFLNTVMGLHLSTADIAALETRTEGWIAGLQLAALSMQGHKDVAAFIQTFTGSHQFVMDYLVEEVLHQQSASIQTFLLQTSILNRLCGSLCDALLPGQSASGQTTLEYLQHANLFIIPLDNERHWYRYHHLFADLLRQRLQQSLAPLADGADRLNQLHIRASQWYEENGLELEAFQHAAAGHDIERAERLIDGKGISFHLRGSVTIILDWLDSLPREVLESRPSLWWQHASLLLVNGQTTGVEEKLQAAEAALVSLQPATNIEGTRIYMGRIATARATLALTKYDTQAMIAQSQRALDYLPPDHPGLRANANWTLGFAYLMRKEYAAARRALLEAIAISQASGNIFTTILATIGLGNVQEAELQLQAAADTYRQVLQLSGDQPLQIIHEAHLGLARILYEWNDLTGAEQHGQLGLHLARQYDSVIDRFIIGEIFLARLKLAQGDIESSLAILAGASQSAQQPHFAHRLPEVAAAQVLALLRQGNLPAAAHLAQAHPLPLSQARVALAQDDPSTALTLLDALYQEADRNGWLAERLQIMVLQALALQQQGQSAQALQLLAQILTVAQPTGCIRLFVDEGLPMAQLLAQASAQGLAPDYVTRVLAAFPAQATQPNPHPTTGPSLIEPLSSRELEILQLIAQGLSNQEISEKLFLALSTVKGHNQTIFAKLQVERRTEAVARAKALGLL